MNKILTITISGESMSENFNELEKEKSNIFKDLDQKIAGKNSAEGSIEKNRSRIDYIFYDEAI